MWKPRPPRDSFQGLVFLPRLLDKARRKLEGDLVGQDLISPYLYGDNDFMDLRLLKFLQLSDQELLAILGAEPDTERAMRQLLAKSGRSPSECEAFSHRLLRRAWYVFLMIEADEDLRKPGIATSLIKAVYLGVVLPPVTWLFNRMEAKRKKAAPEGTAMPRGD